jgi:hypothetical protein
VRHLLCMAECFLDRNFLNVKSGFLKALDMGHQHSVS